MKNRSITVLICVIDFFVAANIVVAFVQTTTEKNCLAFSPSKFCQSLPRAVDNHIQTSTIKKPFFRQVKTDAFSVPFCLSQTKDGISRAKNPRFLGNKDNYPTKVVRHATKECGSIANRKFEGRRKWIIDGIIASLSSITTIPAHAIQTSEGILLPQRSSAVCDQTIECYRKGNKEIFIVGTAHVSSVSAQLSGDVVKEAKPDAVFVELDTQRLGRAFPKGKITRPATVIFFSGGDPERDRQVIAQSVTLLPQDLERRGIFQFFQKLSMKNPIQQMYEEIETQGITPGEEFVNAVEEGLNIGSIIILGDRRMDITLKRLAKALLLYTNPQKLMEADRAITSKMKERMPEIKEWEDELTREGKKSKQLSPDEFTMFVERMKTKEATMEFMHEVQKAAPELYNALVGERDIFMARAMNVLLFSPISQIVPSTVKNIQSLDSMVAVVGLGHLNGIGNELKALGWVKFIPSQC